VLRNALVLVITSSPCNRLADGPGGVVEKLFAWPGVGSLNGRFGVPSATCRRSRAASSDRGVFLFITRWSTSPYVVIDPRIRYG